MLSRVIVAALAIFAVVSVGLSAAETVPLTYEALPEIVGQGNLGVRAANLQAEAAERRTGSLPRSFVPDVTAEGGYETFRTGAYGTEDQPYGSAEVTMNLYHGGLDAAEARLRRAESRAARAQALRTSGGQLLEARQAYWDLVFNRKVIGQLKAAMQRNAKSMPGVRRRVARGLTTGTDIVEFDLHGARLEEDLHSHEHEIVLIEAVLAPLLGHPVGTRFSTPAAFPGLPPVEAGKDGITAEAALASAQAESARAKAGLSSSWRPSLDLYGGYALYTLRDRDYLDRSDRDDTFAGARVALPIFDGGQGRLLRAGHLGQSDAFEARKNFVLQRTAAERMRKLEELKHEIELVSSSDRQIALGQRYMRGTLDEYGRGVKNAPDVVNALERLISLQREGAERRRNAWRIHAELLRLAGETMPGSTEEP